MALMMGQRFDAIENRLAGIEADLRVLMWMVGTIELGVLVLLIEAFH